MGVMPPTPVTLATMETPLELVGMMDCGVAVIQLVIVSGQFARS